MKEGVCHAYLGAIGLARERWRPHRHDARSRHYPDLLYEVARTYLAVGEWSDALELYDALRQVSEYAEVVHAQRGHCLLALARYDEAGVALRASLERQPASVSAASTRRRCCWTTGSTRRRTSDPVPPARRVRGARRGAGRRRAERRRAPQPAARRRDRARAQPACVRHRLAELGRGRVPTPPPPPTAAVDGDVGRAEVWRRRRRGGMAVGAAGCAPVRDARHRALGSGRARLRRGAAAAGAGSSGGGGAGGERRRGVAGGGGRRRRSERRRARPRSSPNGHERPRAARRATSATARRRRSTRSGGGSRSPIGGSDRGSDRGSVPGSLGVDAGCGAGGAAARAASGPARDAPSGGAEGGAAEGSEETRRPVRLLAVCTRRSARRSTLKRRAASWPRSAAGATRSPSRCLIVTSSTSSLHGQERSRAPSTARPHRLPLT